MTSRVALVTGGSQGLGFAAVRALAASGYRVGMVSRSDGHLRDAMAELPDEVRGAVLPLTADVRDPDSIAAGAVALGEHFGGIDVAICAAGVSMSSPSAVTDTRPEEWRRILSTNLDGTYYTLRAALPHLERSDDAHVVTVLSTGAWTVGPGSAVYAASKFGARAVTEGLADEYRGTSIRVSSISPGPIDTTIWTHKDSPPTPQQRAAMLRPDDVAEVLVWLLERPKGMHIKDITVTPWEESS